MRDGHARRYRTLVYVALGLLVIVILYTLIRSPGPPLTMLRRASALFGYTSLFLAILSSEYLREMRKLFGRPFLAVHHRLAVVSLVLIVIHPLTYALENGLLVFVPVLTPFSAFLTWASRPALYLILLAALAARLHARIKSAWKFIHLLNYLAFVLVFVHALLLGTDLGAGLLRLLWAVMAIVVLIVLVHKRLAQPHRA